MKTMRCLSVATFTLLVAASFVLAQASKPAGHLVITKAVWRVKGKHDKDVTAIVAAMVQQDRLDMTVHVKDFSDHPKKDAHGTLSITYALDDQETTDQFRNGQAVWIAAITRQQAQALDRVAEMRKKHPRGLLIVDAQYGAGKNRKNVTGQLQALVWQDSLTVPVSVEAFGDPAPSQGNKTLIITYDDGTELKTDELPENSTLQIGKVKVPVLAKNGTLIDLRARYAEYSQRLHCSFVVLSARYGEGNGWVDVTDMAQSAVSGDSMTLPVSAQAFGNPRPGGFSHLEISYSPDGKQFITRKSFGPTLQVGPLMTAITPLTGGILNCRQRAKELRQQHQGGLLILYAIYGTGNGFVEVTDQLQKLATHNSLQVPVNSKNFGDPQPGSSGKWLTVTYWDGRQGVTVRTPEGAQLKIRIRSIPDEFGDPKPGKKEPASPKAPPPPPDRTSGQAAAEPVFPSFAGSLAGLPALL
jgi:hypothetical protein